MKSGFYDGPTSQALDELARDGIPIAGFDLMQRAAEAALTVIIEQFPSASRLIVICGKGNNGGDGYLIAARAIERGLRATAVALVDPLKLTGDAALAHQAAQDAGVVIRDSVGSFEGYDVIVDAMLGTGFSGEPRDFVAEAITAINSSSLPVVAVDLPSGVSASTGAANLAVRAHHTVTFISRKVGTFTGPGRALSGMVHFCDLGVPEHLYSTACLTPCYWHPNRLPALDSGAYKHQLGSVLVAGGDLGMPGAAAMAAEAALRVGAGMVTVATHREHAHALLTRLPEAMTVNPEGSDFEASIENYDLVVLGPGLGREAWGENLFRAIERSGRPVVLDADGLWWLAEVDSWQGGPLWMTPHAAEAARLLDQVVAELESDRVTAAATLADRFAGRVNLKGPGSIVHCRGRAQLCIHGNPGMATAGMGDVLSGIVGGILSGGYRQGASDDVLDDLFSAAIALHSRAGDRAAQVHGMRSLVATDVVRALPETICETGETNADV